MKTDQELLNTADVFPEEKAEYERTKAVELEMVVAKPQSMTIKDTDATNFLDPNLYLQMKALANDFIKSKAIPSVWQDASQVLVGLQTGVEMGMKPMEAMNSLYPVNGAINVWGKATTRRLKEHGWKIQYSDESQESCTATVSRGDESYTETIKFKDAELSGYTKDKNGYLKIGWKPGINRVKKLRYGVLAMIIHTYIPDVLGSAIGIVEVSEDYDVKNTLTEDVEAQKANKKLEARNRLHADN